MGRREDMVRRVTGLMRNLERIRNIGIAAHIDHGKTTLSDTLLAGCGMMSEELAGKQLFMDYYELEQTRGITINAANVSLVHPFEEEDYLINLIDTPGHVDFGGDVTRAMRAVDGVIVLVDAVEGVMPQTETVIRQALKEKGKPVLFVNKVDRLINELKVTPEEMQQRFTRIIADVNELIKSMAQQEYEKRGWVIKVEDGSVAFGSALYHWAISAPYMKKTGITFRDIYDYCSKNDQGSLAKRAPVHQIIADMVVRHLPSPLEAQPYRIPQIWHGDLDSECGKGMVKCDAKAPTSFMVTKIIIDPHAGEVAVGRVYSGSIRKGDELFVVGMPHPDRVQQVGIFMGPDRIPVDTVSSGNIVAVTGLKNAVAGSTVTNGDMISFERIVHVSEPVVTVAIEARHAKDLPKLIEVLRQIAKEDPSIYVEINQETGEHLVSGMGELHLEVTQYRIQHDRGVDIVTSEPIVVYRECVQGHGGPFEGKSPNKHNRFYLEVEPLEPEIERALLAGKIPERIKDKKATARQLQELGMPKVDARGVVSIHGPNVFTDVTRGKQYLYETMELISQSFVDAMGKGPLAAEHIRGLKVRLVDVKLHEDAIHRGPAQVIPAVRYAIYGAMCTARPILLEPKVRVFINVPADMMGDVTREMQGRRGVIEQITQEGNITTVTAKVPVAEMFGFASDIRSVTEGKALWSTEYAGFEPLPSELQAEVVRGIRKRKGMKLEVPGAEHYAA